MKNVHEYPTKHHTGVRERWTTHDSLEAEQASGELKSMPGSYEKQIGVWWNVFDTPCAGEMQSTLYRHSQKVFLPSLEKPSRGVETGVIHGDGASEGPNIYRELKDRELAA